MALAPIAAGQGARHGADRAVQRQLADRRAKPSMASGGMAPIATIMASAIGRSKWLPSLGRSAGARLTVMCLNGQAEAHGVQRVAHPLAALGHGLVGQADDGEHVLAAGDAHLHLDGPGLDADEGDRGDLPVHAFPRPPRIAGATLMG